MTEAPAPKAPAARADSSATREGVGPRVVVVGAGISGLAAAHEVLRLRPDANLRVLEASSRAGGALFTERADGFVLERGPDAILTERPEAQVFFERLGIAEELVGTVPACRGAYVVCRGRLVRIPQGFSLMAPLDARAFLASSILSRRGKARAFCDLVLPRRPHDGDESLEHFVTRRFGRELFERLAQPLVGGIYGADPKRLSLRATLPRFVDAEQATGSVIRGLRRLERARARGDAGGVSGIAGARYGMFVSFAGGNGRLAERAAARLGDRVQLGCEVTGLVRTEGGAFRLSVQNADRAPSARTIDADAVILAVPSAVAQRLLGAVDAGLVPLLSAIEAGSVATVLVAYRREQIAHALDAYGFVVPTVERRPSIAATWMSRKWPDRAPPGFELIRVFLGGYAHPELVDQADDALLQIATQELQALMAITGAPILSRIDRWKARMPQYLLGHQERVSAIDARVRALGALRLAGNHWTGVGIPHAIGRGEAMAREILDALSERARP